VATLRYELQSSPLAVPAQNRVSDQGSRQSRQEGMVTEKKCREAFGFLVLFALFRRIDPLGGRLNASACSRAFFSVVSG